MAFSFFKNLFLGKGKSKTPQPTQQQTIKFEPLPTPVIQPAPPPVAQPQYTHNEQFLVDGNELTMASTNVEDIRWDVNTDTLTVRFKSGGVYEYYGVPLSVVIAFVETDSPGRFVWNKLRDLYPYAKVGEAQKRPKANVVRLINR